MLTYWGVSDHVYLESPVAFDSFISIRHVQITATTLPSFAADHGQEEHSFFSGGGLFSPHGKLFLSAQVDFFFFLFLFIYFLNIYIPYYYRCFLCVLVIICIFMEVSVFFFFCDFPGGIGIVYTFFVPGGGC